MANSSESEVERLRQQNEALDGQVKQLVKTEQRLFRYQRALDQQLRRINAVNQLALEAATAFEPRQILDIGLSTLMTVLSLDQGIGCLADPDGKLTLACHSSVRGLEFDSAQRVAALENEVLEEELPSEATIAPWGALLTAVSRLRPFVKLMEHIFEPAQKDTEATSVYVVTPLYGPRSRRPLGMLLLRTWRTRDATYHDRLPDASDLPFLQLLRSHLECTLENAILHQRLSVLASELEQRVSERTEALSALNIELEENLTELRTTQSQLFQAGKLAAIGTLVAGLSHELNTPLNIIMGYSQSLLALVDDSDPMQAPLKAITRQSRRCTNLVKSLLDFSRDRPPERRRVSPEDVLKRVFEFTVQQATNRSLTQEVDSPWTDERAVRLENPKAERVDLFASAVEVESALLNLVSNALDATPDGGCVTIRAEAETRDHVSGVLFSVIDNGSGIPADAQPFIFDPFYTTKPVGEGTGLGLALSQRIADAHEGELDFVTSEEGTTMRLFIPKYHGQAAIT